MAKPSKRIYLINRDFQLRYAYAAVFVGLMSTIVTTTVLLYPLYKFEIVRIPQFLPLPIMSAMVAAALINVFDGGIVSECFLRIVSRVRCMLWCAASGVLKLVAGLDI